MIVLFLCIAVCACCTTSLCARDVVPAGNDTFVFFRTGEAVRGELLGVDSDSLAIVADGIMRFARTDIARIIVRHDNQSERGFCHGSLLGVVGLGLLTQVAAGQPGMFMEMDAGNTRSNTVNGRVLFIAAALGLGGGIGLLLDSGDDTAETVFLFTGRDDGETWEQLRTWLRGAATEKKLRISVASAYVVQGMGSSFEKHVRAAGGFVEREYSASSYRTSYFSGDEYAGIEAATSINLLRRIQIAYEVIPAVEAGAAVIWTGEPLVYASRAGEHESEFSSLRQELRGRGYYAIALYHTGFRSLPRVDIAVGGGIGVMQATYRLHGVAGTRTSEYADITQRYSTEFSAAYCSAVLTADCSYRLYNSLSVGITADYVFTPSSRVVPAVPFAGFPEQRFAPGNGSIGITLGMYF